MKLFELFGEIKIDDDKANKALGTIDSKAEKVFKKMAGIVAGAVSVGAIVGMSKKVIELGADAEEMYNKYNVVFNGMTNDVDKWADEFAKSRGRSSTETKGMLADLADLQQGFGLTQDQSLGMSKKIVNLATDLASFNNVNDATAIEAVSKAMIGEAEMAKQLGLALNVENVKEYTESQGLVYDELDKVVQMQMVYQLAVQQSQNALGDAERSSGSFTNQMKALKANLKDTAVEIGMSLMPAAATAVTFINEKVVPGFMDFAGRVKDVFLEIKDRLQPYIEILTGFIAENWPKMQETGTQLFSKITEKVAELYKWFNENLYPIFVELFEWAVGFWPTLQNVGETVFKAIIEVVSTLWDWFSTYLLPIFVNVFEWVVENLPTFQKIFEEVFTIIKAVVEPLWDIFENYLLPILGVLFDWANEKAMKIADFISEAFTIISEVVGGVADVFESLTDWIGKAVDKWNEWTNRPADKTPSGFGGINPGQYTTGGADTGLTGYKMPSGGSVFNTTINANTTVGPDEMDNIVNVNNSRMAYKLGI